LINVPGAFAGVYVLRWAAATGGRANEEVRDGQVNRRWFGVTGKDALSAVKAHAGSGAAGHESMSSP